MKSSAEAVKWNVNTKYPVPHFAGCSPSRTKSLFKRFIHDYFTGMSINHKELWGLKHLWIFANKQAIKQIEEIFPDCRWVVCVRHPFKAYNSQKNTFVKDQNLDIFLKSWVGNIKNAQEKENATIIQVDKTTDLSFAQRKKTMNNLLTWIGVGATDQTIKFVEEWPRVHKADFARSKEKFELPSKVIAEQLEKNSDLRVLMDEMQYAP